MSIWVRILLAVLATWRVSQLIAGEDGPAGVLARLRAAAGRRWFGRLMDCFACVSVWVAAPLALFVDRHFTNWLMSWWALTGAACLLDRVVQDSVVVTPLPPEEGE